MDALNTGSMLTIKKVHWQAMRQDVIDKNPEEACGILAGRNTKSQMLYIVTNELHSPIRFHMSPEEQLAALMDIDECGFEMLAIYHSHPAGPARPSPTDVAEFAYPGVLYLIWVNVSGLWDCFGYEIENGSFRPVRFNVLESE